MESFFINPGLQDIGEAIFMSLTPTDLVSNRLVSSKWGALLNQPRFWMKICVREGMETEIWGLWMALIKVLEEDESDLNYVNGQANLHLMKMCCRSKFEYPLHLASRTGKLALANYIVNYLDSPWNDEDNYNPIHLAAKFGHAKIVKILANLVDEPNSPEFAAVTPMLLAARFGYDQVVDELLNYEDAMRFMFECGGLSDFNVTPIIEASKHNRVRVIEVFAKRLSNPNPSDATGWTPIHEAARWGNSEVVRILAKHTNFPNRSDFIGRTPIFIASRNGHIEVVRTLIPFAMGLPNDSTRSLNKWTPMHAAAMNGHVEIVKLLSETYEDPRNAMATLKCESGWTPLRLAMKNGHDKVVNIYRRTSNRKRKSPSWYQAIGKSYSKKQRQIQ